MPKNGNTSVFQINGLSEVEVWSLGATAGGGRGIPRARADILITDIESLQLTVSKDDSPPRHANIGNWPDSKDERMLKAQELAKKATLKLDPL